MKPFLILLLSISLVPKLLFAEEVELPKFQELAATIIEQKFKDFESVRKLASEFKSNYFRQNDLDYISAIEKSDFKVSKSVVSRVGRTVKISMNEIAVEIEVIDALNQKYKINGYPVELLKHKTLRDKHKYMAYLLDLKRKSVQIPWQMRMLRGEEASAQITGLGVASTIGGGASAGLVCILTAPICGTALTTTLIVGAVSVAGAASYMTFCANRNSNPLCNTPEVRAALAYGKVGEEIEKLIGDSGGEVVHNCKTRTFKVSQNVKGRMEELNSELLKKEYLKCCDIYFGSCDKKVDEYYAARRNQNKTFIQDNTKGDIRSGTQ